MGPAIEALQQKSHVLEAVSIRTIGVYKSTGCIIESSTSIPLVPILSSSRKLEVSVILAPRQLYKLHSDA